MSGQLTSRGLALATAGLNLVVCGAVVTALVLLDKGSRPDPGTTEAQPPAPPAATVTEQPPTTTTVSVSSTPAVAEHLQNVTGSGGMTTAIPAGWPTARAAGPGSTQATDPADATRYVRYGGSAVPDEDTYPVHVAYERDFAKSHKAFESIRLERTVLRGAPAVDWEFEWEAPEGRRHVRSIYWRAQGYEYFLYASSLVGRWPQTEPILDDMINHATP